MKEKMIGWLLAIWLYIKKPIIDIEDAELSVRSVYIETKED